MGVITERYSATVTSNEDDENRGRIKVACAQLLGDEETELPMWVEPLHDWGWFYVPDVGETVEVEVIVGSDEDEVQGQMSIDNMDIHWRGKRYYTVDEPEGENTEARPIHPDFLEVYGKRRGFATPFGHIFMMDDTPDAPTMWLTWMKEQLEVGATPEPEKYSRLEIEPDGSLKITLLNKHTIHFQTEGNKLLIEVDEQKHKIELDAETPKIEVSLAEGEHTVVMDGSAPSLEVNLANGDHNVKLNDGQFTANTGGGAGVDVAGKDADATTTLGDGAVSAAIAEHLQEYIDNKVKIAFDTHIHPTGMGPSGPPTKPLDPYESNITSSKLVFPDG